MLVCDISSHFILFHFDIYMYMYLPDSQKSDGGVIHIRLVLFGSNKPIPINRHFSELVN